MNPATIYDVAKRAGVSHQTVTRFLRGFEGIRPETRQRVETALKELDYRPNSAARLLRSRQTNRVGVLADRIDQNGPSRILNAISELAHARGYVLDIVIADSTSSGSVASSLAVLTDHQVAGILATAHTEVVLEEINRQALRAPLVVSRELEMHTPGPSPNEVAGAVAADHLLDLGHRRVGYVAGPELWFAAQGRAGGFTRRVVERGGEVVWLRYGDWTPSSGFQIWSDLTDAERKVTAVGFGNDSMAIGLIAAATDMGYRIPHDLSVVGTDDLAEARYLRPSLTTVGMDFEQEGRFLMETLIARIEEVADIETRLPGEPQIIVRNSTASAPRR